MQFSTKFKLDFIIAGAQKSGTTALHSYLQLHPEIAMPSIKELHFFDNEAFFERKKPKYNWIKKQFSNKKKANVFGEATPIYMYWKPCIERIFNYNSEIKIICILRNPIHRAFSQWNHELELKNEKRDFLDCIKEEEKLISANVDFQDPIKSYIGRGFYGNQIVELRKYFNEKQLLFIKYEDFLQNQEKTVAQVLLFLRLIPKHKIFTENFEQNYKVYKRKIKEDEIKYLKEIYKDEIGTVEKLLNWDCKDWKNC